MVALPKSVEVLDRFLILKPYLMLDLFIQSTYVANRDYLLQGFLLDRKR